MKEVYDILMRYKLDRETYDVLAKYGLDIDKKAILFSAVGGVVSEEDTLNQTRTNREIGLEKIASPEAVAVF